MSEEESTRKHRGQCDICGRFTWVSTQYLGASPVASQCRKCNRLLDNDEAEEGEESDDKL